jgi:hypothetical protein
MLIKGERVAEDFYGGVRGGEGEAAGDEADGGYGVPGGRLARDAAQKGRA